MRRPPTTFTERPDHPAAPSCLVRVSGGSAWPSGDVAVGVARALVDGVDDGGVLPGGRGGPVGVARCVGGNACAPACPRSPLPAASERGGLGLNVPPQDATAKTPPGWRMVLRVRRGVLHNEGEWKPARQTPAPTASAPSAPGRRTRSSFIDAVHQRPYPRRRQNRPRAVARKARSPPGIPDRRNHHHSFNDSDRHLRTRPLVVLPARERPLPQRP
jgi:hypothetical protein